MMRTVGFGIVALCATVALAATSPYLGTQPYGNGDVKVVLVGASRTEGDTLQLNWYYQNTSSVPQKIGDSFTGMGSSEQYSLVWDVYIVDPASAVKYPVVRDSRGNPLASFHGGRKTVVLAPKQIFSAWARVSAPPASVKKISVYIPGATPFDDIAIAPQS